tara:strand:+ start:811 stop:1029 length:219 start_codon:yes stop_codon:yes gene_type:complete
VENLTYDTNEWFDAVDAGLEPPTTLANEEMNGRPPMDETWEEDEERAYMEQINWDNDQHRWYLELKEEEVVT